MDLSCIAWRKSTLSGANGCVQVAFIEDRVAVRDSKDRGGPVLMFTAHEWEAFIGEARSEELELAGSPPTEEVTR